MRILKLSRDLFIVLALFTLFFAASNDSPSVTKPVDIGPTDKVQLPTPFATPSARNTSKVIGWPKGKMPLAAPGLEVSLFADGFDNPRSSYVLPNRDILVVEAVREWVGRADQIGRAHV